MTKRLITAVLVSTAVITTACTGNPAQSAAPVSTPTATSEAPAADPTEWFEAYCGPMGVAAIASLEAQGKGAEGMAAIKDAAVRWAATSAASDLKIAEVIEKLGPLGSDVRSPHERLVKALRKEAERFDQAATRLRALAANDVFPERYDQVVASETGVLADEVAALFEQIATTPKYAETFRANKVCVEWQKMTEQLPGK